MSADELTADHVEQAGRLLMPSFIEAVREIIEPFEARLSRVEGLMVKVGVVTGTIGMIAGFVVSLIGAFVLKLLKL